MTAPAQLRQCLSILLLPIPKDTEAKCCRVLRLTLRQFGLGTYDFRDWLELQLGMWKDTNTPSEQLLKTVVALLREADPDVSRSLAEKYFLVHKKLMSDHLMSHQEARAFMSNAFLMIGLARRELFSAAQISKFLERRDDRVQFSRQAVTLLIDAVGLKRELSTNAISRLFAKDSSLELSTFADADLETAAQLVGEAAIPLGFAGDIVDSLRILAPIANLATYTPYIQVLHYQCVIAEFYDHAITDLYEFSPRGQAAGWLFNAYPTPLVSAGNPFLNNMKSVGIIDSTWARSKKQAELPGANALLQILVGLETMNFAARRELARLIRLWIHRVMRLSASSTISLPSQLSAQHISSLLTQLGTANTETYGVLEQRVVDSIADQYHLPTAGWRSRGLGDSVNATNVSRRKIGDCDFQHPGNYQIEAYEAHAGVLTNVYVDDHLRTLKKVMAMRVEELRGISDLPSWNIKITFVAHEIRVTGRTSVAIEGVSIALNYVTFSDFISTSINSGCRPDWTRRLILPLSQSQTPVEIQRTLLECIGI